MEAKEARRTVQNIITDRSHVLVASPTGGGKSYYVGFVVEQMYAARMPFIVLDTSDQNHIGLLKLKGVRILRIRKTENPDYSKILNHPYILCIPDENMKIGELIDEYRKIIETIFQAAKPRAVILEEVHYYSKNSSSPDQTLDKLSREGRKYGIFGWFITQRCQDLPKIFWSSCRYYMILKYWLHTDISYLENQINHYSDVNAGMQLHDVLVYNSQIAQHTILPAQAIKRVTKHYG